MRLTKRWGASLTAGILSVLPTFTNVKIGSLQPEDFVLLALLGFCFAKWILEGFQVRLPSMLSGLFKGYACLLALLLVFSFLDRRLTFYPLEDTSILKTPFLYSASRFLQFSAVICGFLWLSSALIRDRLRLDRAIELYWRTGILSSLYAVVSYIALRGAHIDLLGAYGDESLRARGFFIEGGPFGLYLVSVIMIGLLRRHLTGKRIGYLNILIIGAAFLLSQSKAGFFALVFVFFLSILSAVSFRKRVVYVALAVIVLGGFAAAVHLDELLTSYFQNYQNVENKLALLGEDPNLVTGRIAAAYIVPRMVEAHPITGIGIGNYPLMRNDPHYLGALPSMRYFEDEPGLGLMGYSSELGLPATVFLLMLLVVPYGICRKAAPIIGLTALVQVTSQLLGAQPTFFYPWFVTACALAASKYPKPAVAEESPVHMFLRFASISDG